ncbi:hypothetical protein M527_01135 [Sphingobium indicum IP26]|nr:hypothetical protein M527_01135 [Sphingobium indicum IP26]
MFRHAFAEIKKPIHSIGRINLARIAQRYRPFPPHWLLAVIKNDWRNNMDNLSRVIRQGFKCVFGDF